jgi:hypothetical protein
MRNDSFEDWLKRHSDWKTKIAVFIVIFLAGIGLVFLMDRIWPCKISDGCDPYAEYNPADHQW